MNGEINKKVQGSEGSDKDYMGFTETQGKEKSATPGRKSRKCFKALWTNSGAEQGVTSWGYREEGRGCPEGDSLNRHIHGGRGQLGMVGGRN
jgi:hypothetical protein